MVDITKTKIHTKDIVHIDCFNHIYDDGTKVNVCDTHFCAKYGEVIIISGKNGSGKSTLLNHIVGLLSTTKGMIKIMDVDITSREFENIRRNIGVVFQDVEEQLIAPTVFEDIAFGPLNYGITREKTELMVTGVMKKLNISHLKDKVPHYLSGGEKKKVALAGAVVMNPKLLILDEVFANMDEKSKTEIAKFLQELNKVHNTTIIMTSHEQEVIKKLKARIYHIGL